MPDRSRVTPLTVTGLGAGTGLAPLVKFSVYGPPVAAPSVRFTVHWFGVTLVNEADSVTGLPWTSYVLIDVTIGVGLVVSAGRFPVTVTLPVAFGASRVLNGRLIGPLLALVLTTPLLLALQPCTMLPSVVTSEPLESKENEPLRVNRSCPALLTTKKPSPWIIRSVSRPVFWAAPWEKLLWMPARRTPRPTCAGLVPPVPVVGPPAPRTSWLSVSWKVVWLALYPVVLTLAMLLPVTSIICWCARRPLMPENRERSMVWVCLSFGGCRSSGGAADFRDRGQRHILVTDLEGRLAAREGGGRDDTAAGGPVRVGEGDRAADHGAGRLQVLRATGGGGNRLGGGVLGGGGGGGAGRAGNAGQAGDRTGQDGLPGGSDA